MTRPEQIGPELADAMAFDGPSLLEVVVGPEQPRAARERFRDVLGLPDPLRGVPIEALRAVFRLPKKR